MLAAVGDAADILDETGLGIHVSPDCPEKMIAAFDEMVERYDAFLGHRERAMQIIREKHSRQAAVLQLEKQLRSLCGMKEEVLL